MRIPHTLRVNVIKVYTSSAQARQLVGEVNRGIEADNFAWDKYEPLSLMDTCVKVMTEGFELCFEYIKRLPRQDLDYVLEILKTDLPIHLTVPNVEDGIYWKRCCGDHWPDETINPPKSSSWKKVFLERYLQQLVESQNPNLIDWKTLEITMNACADYVTRLHLQQLLPPPNLKLIPVSPDECVRGSPVTSHIDLSFLLSRLPKLQELSIRYCVKNCGMQYEHYYFQISEEDVVKLADGLRSAPSTLESIALHRCQIDDIKLNILLSALKEMNISSLDLSHCNFGNIGAKSLAKLMSVHKNLTSLSIENNSFGAEGLMAIAFVLNNTNNCCPLQVLKLDLNIFGDEGISALASALVSNSTLIKLSVAGCGITNTGVASLMASLHFNNTLVNLNVSSNNLSNDCCSDVLLALEVNTCIQVLDFRNSGIDNEMLSSFEIFIRRNRRILRNSKLKQGDQSMINFF